MSFPIAAGGPVKVEIKPILTVLLCASAGPLTSVSAAPAAIHAFFILTPPVGHGRASEHVKVLAVLPFADRGLFSVIGRFLVVSDNLSFLHASIVVHELFAKSGAKTSVRA